MSIIDLTEDKPEPSEPTVPDNCNEMEVVSNDDRDLTTTTTTTTSPLIDGNNIKVCGVCKEKPPKYKCTRCLLPYCSIACSTVHKATHSADEPNLVPAKPLLATGSSNTSGPTAKPLAGTVAAAGMKGPFAALDHSNELQTLFKTFPTLRAMLEDIYEATLRPVDNSNMNNGPRKSRGAEQWNQDRGMEKGLTALRKARMICGEDGEGVREYSRLVLKILSGEDGPDASEIVQRELNEQNARIIQQLLEAEKR